MQGNWVKSCFGRTGLGGLGAVFAVCGVACGPSFQAMYDADARFEHCYALDESASVSLSDKGRCWQEWNKHYTFGQTRDRIEYAAARHRALSKVPEVPSDEAMMAAAPGEGEVPRNAAPAPTSAYAPPPPTLAAAFDAGVQRTLPNMVLSAAPVRGLPAAECGGLCSETYKSCGSHCAGTVCSACERDYRRCMRDCFVDDAPRGAEPKRRDPKSGKAPR
jgi:hypothetical protein